MKSTLIKKKTLKALLIRSKLGSYNVLLPTLNNMKLLDNSVQMEAFVPKFVTMNKNNENLYMGPSQEINLNEQKHNPFQNKEVCLK